ncbi:MAG: hypothetical protein M4579_001038 [Chaenotheca gracillima]|nr:MAG: hypothetical protein M4579_001038 [Chaenotheca gracillima]
MSNDGTSSASPTSAYYQQASYDAQAPPPPPPKPSSHEHSRLGTPSATNGGAPPPVPPHPTKSAGQWQSNEVSSGPPSRQDPASYYMYDSGNGDSSQGQTGTQQQIRPDSQVGGQPYYPQQELLEDPLGPDYVPTILQTKTTADLTNALSTPALLNALSHAPPPPALLNALSQNIHLAGSLSALENRLKQQRHTTQTHLLHCHALERAWRAKQAEMDEVLAPFAPKALYQRLNAAVAEQEAVCQAVVETFLDGDSGRGASADGSEGKASEREVAEWLRRVREERKVYWRRREAKARWDDGRVGGWR